MTDSIKFGPEWLRNMSNDVGANLNNSSLTSRFPLADFRYGREEFLSLFDKTIKTPDTLPKYKKLYVERPQCPLALTTTTEEELRVWPVRSPNSTIVGGRGIGRGGVTSPTISRGRGTRGGYFPRPDLGSRTLFEEESLSRVGGVAGRGWTDRNGTETSEWNNHSTSPSKNYNIHTRSTTENWRRNRTTDDDTTFEGWRSTNPREKWQRSTSWREDDGPPDQRLYQGENKQQSQTGGNKKYDREWESDDTMPEWALDDNMEIGGSFDSSGEFHGCEDDDGQQRNQRYQQNESVENDSYTETNDAEQNGDETINNNNNNLEEQIHEEVKSNTPTFHVNMERMQEVADDMVKKLFMEDEAAALAAKNVSQQQISPKEELAMQHENHQQKLPQQLKPIHPLPVEMWFYRDPQCNIQGPFTASEMTEWYRAGYFNEFLSVRRSFDQHFVTLGELVKRSGGSPFVSTPNETIRSINYQLQLLQAQYLIRQRNLIISQLAVTDPWQVLTIDEQNSLINQHMSQIDVPEHLLPIPQNAPAQQINLALQLIVDGMNVTHPVNDFETVQIPHQRPPPPHMPFVNMRPIQPVHQIPIQLQPPPKLTPQQLPPPPNLDNDPIKSLIIQLSLQKGIQPVQPVNEWIEPTQSPVKNQSWQQQQQIGLWDMPVKKIEPQIEQWTGYQPVVVQPQPQQPPPQQQQPQHITENEIQKKELSEKLKKDDEEKKLKKQQSDIDRARKDAKKEADEKKRELDEKKKLKRQQQIQLEDEERKRNIEDERRRRLFETEQKLAIADEKKRKLIEQEQLRSTPSIAPWSQPPATISGPSLAEIQKAELERARVEQFRLEQTMREQIQQNQAAADLQSQKENVLIWNARNVLPQNIKSLAEIQAEEHAKQAAIEREQQFVMASVAKKKEPIEKRQQDSSSIWNKIWSAAGGPSPTGNKVWGTTNQNSSGFWEEQPIKSIPVKTATPVQKTLIKSQTMSNITPPKSIATTNGKLTTSKIMKNLPAPTNLTAMSSSGMSKSTSNNYGKISSKKDEGINQEFIIWCTKALSSISASLDTKIDVPTFVGFLQDIESAYEVKEYIRLYLGESRESSDFGKQFLERRSKYKNQQRAQNAHIDDMCSPAPAITPCQDFQEGKGKKIKKGKMMKLDSRILGFSVTAAQDRINVGDRDYGDIP